MRSRWSIRAALVAIGLGLGSLGLIHEPPTRPLELSRSEPAMDADVSLATIPALENEPHEGSVLERRLAALAAAVETRQAPAPNDVDFDVEGLGEQLGDVVDQIDDQAQVSVHVRDLETQQVLFDYFGDAPLNPASNQKILTSSAALDLLGADYRFTTRVVRSGRDLIIVGGGDPMIDDEELANIVAEVAATIDPAEFERIVVDDTAFSTRRFGPGYPQSGPGYAYEAPSGALSLNFNSISVRVARKRGEANPVVTVEPAGAHVVIDNQTRIAKRRTGPWVRTYAEGDTTVVEVTGRMTRRSRAMTVRRRVTDPGLFAASVFAQGLAEATATEPLPVVRGAVPSDAEKVVTHESEPLIEILDSGLAYSNNFIAEQVLRTMAWKMTGHPGDWESGAVDSVRLLVRARWRSASRGRKRLGSISRGKADHVGPGGPHFGGSPSRARAGDDHRRAPRRRRARHASQPSASKRKASACQDWNPARRQRPHRSADHRGRTAPSRL